MDLIVSRYSWVVDKSHDDMFRSKEVVNLSLASGGRSADTSSRHLAALARVRSVHCLNSCSRRVNCCNFVAIALGLDNVSGDRILSKPICDRTCMSLSPSSWISLMKRSE